MEITLATLNESYRALERLAQRELPKEQHKLTYKISRVMRSAKTEIELLAESLNDLMRSCGIEPGDENADLEKAKDYAKQAKNFMTATRCQLWGDPIRLDEIMPHVSISAFDLALLDWLIIEEEQAKAATA